MATELTIEQVRKAVADVVESVVADFENKPDTDREEIIERMDEECDTLFGQLVRQGRIDKYDVDDLIATAGPCAAIIATAKKDAWVEDDSGLWEGLTYGVLASVAFFSLRNLLNQELLDAGYDTNNDYPFAKDEDTDADEDAEPIDADHLAAVLDAEDQHPERFDGMS